MLKSLKRFCLSFFTSSGKHSSRQQLRKTFSDSPYGPFGSGETSPEDLFKRPEFRRLTEILEQYAPYLVTQLAAATIPRARDAKDEIQKLHKLDEKVEELAARKAEAEAKAEAGIQPLPSDLYIQENEPKPASSRHRIQLFIAIVGSSFALFLSLNHLTGINTRSLRQSQYPMTAVNLGAALGITIATKLTTAKLAKQSSLYDPKRSYIDDQNHLNIIPWWDRMKNGDGAMWAGGSLMVLETCFAGPGLVGLLPLEQAAQWSWIFAMTAAASLPATANVTLAWSCGAEEANQQRDDEMKRKEFEAKLEQIRQSDSEIQQHKHNTELQCHAKALAERLTEVQRQLANQEVLASDMFERARLEYVRWEHEVKLWFENNPGKAEEFYRYRQQLSTQPIHNGHALIPEVSLK